MAATSYKFGDYTPYLYRTEDYGKTWTLITNGIPTPVLYVCGKGTEEIRYTKYLAYYLDLNQNHGLKDKLFKEIFSKIIKRYNLQITNYKVLAEQEIGSYTENEENIRNDCDIVINSQNFNIFIEQKILSSESINTKTKLKQLERYDIAISNNDNYSGKQNIKIYLTPEKKENFSSNDWLNITHKEIINSCLNVIEKETLSEIAKNNLLSLLSDLTINFYSEVDIINLLKKLTTKILQYKKISDIKINNIVEFKKSVRRNEFLFKMFSKY